MKMLRKKKDGFTLVELLVVIAIIGILFVVLISKVDFATEKAKATGVQTDFRSYQMAMETVAMEQGGFSAVNGVTATKALITDALKKNLDKALQFTCDADGNATTTAKDPWGKAYTIVVTPGAAGTGKVVVTSGGPDGSTDTTDDYTITTAYTADGVKTTTTGFSKQIE